MKKGFIEYIILIIILIILVGATIFYLNSNPEPINTTPTLPPNAFTAPTIEPTEQPATNGYESTGSITMPTSAPTTFDINDLNTNASSIDSKLAKLSTDVTAINTGLNDQMGDLSE